MPTREFEKNAGLGSKAAIVALKDRKIRLALKQPVGFA